MAAKTEKGDAPKKKPADPNKQGAEKKAKPKKEAAPATVAEAPAPPKPVEPPPLVRPAGLPADVDPKDPRLKVLKKMTGRFLPKGPLRDRYKAIALRWKSDSDRAGVTVDELKSLLADWRASREKPAKANA